MSSYFQSSIEPATGDRHELVADINDVLESATSLLRATTVAELSRQVVDLVVPHIADSASVVLCSSDGAPCLHAFAHCDRGAEPAYAAQLNALLQTPQTSRQLRELIASHEVIFASGDAEATVQARFDEAASAFVRQIGLSGLIMAPLIGSERALGILAISTVKAPATTDLRRFTRTLARHVGLYVEHLRLTAELRASEARYRALTEQTSSMVWRVGGDGKPVDEMEGWREFTGQDGDLASGWVDAVHPDDLACTLERWQHAFATHSRYDAQYRLRHRDGSWRHVRLVGVPILGDGGEVREWVGTLTDDTDRIVAQRKAAADHALLRSVLDSTSDIVFAKDVDGRYVMLNQAGVEQTGMTVDKMLGKTDIELFPTEVAERIRGEELEVIEANEPRIFDETMPFGDRTVHFQTVRVPHRGADGMLLGVVGVARDMTAQYEAEAERQRAEQALQMQVNRFQMVQRATNDIIWDWDLGTDTITWSENFSAALGYERTPETSALAWWIECLHPDDRDQANESMHAAIQNGADHWTEEYRIRRADGTYAIMFDRAAILRVNGTAVRMLGTMADVTNLRVKELELARRTTELHAIVNAFPDMYFWIDGNGVVHDCLIGRGADGVGEATDYIGQSIATLCRPEEVDRFLGAVRHALSTGNMVVLERETQTPTGTRWSETRMAPVGPDRVISIVRDVTERREAEREARERDAQYRVVTDGLPLLISYIGPDSRYRFVNATYERMLGRPREEFVGRTIEEMLGSRVARRVEPFVERALHGEASQFSVEIPMPDGIARHMAVSYVPYRDVGGAVIGFFAVTEDVSEKMALEEQVRHSQKMEALGRLAGGVAHDFNNLLTVISTSVEFALGALDNGEDIRNDLDQVARAATRAAGLTRQLLAFGRKQVVKPQIVSVNDVVSEAEYLLRRTIGEDILLFLSLDAGAPRTLIDKGQLEQVLMNLVVNARDAMPHGGTLRVSTRVTTHREAPDASLPAGSYVEITVADTGFGMDAVTRSRVFEPFFTTKDVGKGTGLGLATVYGIVRHAKGATTIESKQGGGTTMRVYLPLVADASIVSEMPVIPAAPRGTEHVLLAEDEAGVRQLVRRTLERSGYRVSEAVNGRDALNQLETIGPIDAVVTDLVMPQLGGIGLLEALRARFPSIPAVLISGYSDEPVQPLLQQEETRAITVFVSKPFTSHDLLQQLRDVLDRRR